MGGLIGSHCMTFGFADDPGVEAGGGKEIVGRITLPHS